MVEYETSWTRTCPECGRVFHLDVESESEEYYYGHDCE